MPLDHECPASGAPCRVCSGEVSVDPGRMMWVEGHDMSGRQIVATSVQTVEAAHAEARANNLCVSYVIMNSAGVEVESWTWLYDEETETGCWKEN